MSRSISKSALCTQPKVKPGDEVVGPDGNFGTVMEVVGDHAYCVLEAPCKRLKLKKSLSISQPQLERLNNESIRLNLRANIWENMVAALPRDQQFEIVRRLPTHRQGRPSEYPPRPPRRPDQGRPARRFARRDCGRLGRDSKGPLAHHDNPKPE